MYLLDTNIISEASRPGPNVQVLAWIAGLERLTASVISIAEVEYGLNLVSEQRRLTLRLWFEELERATDFVPVNNQIASLAGRLRAEVQKKGKQLSLADGLIAATAAVTKSTLATRNVKDFEHCGIAIFNPFQATT